MRRKHNDNLVDNYPYAKELLNKHDYKPVSFVETKFGKVIRASKTTKTVWAPDGVEFNITTDVRYEVLLSGNTKRGLI